MAFAVRCDELTPEQSVCDPTCGSGTLLLAAAKTCADKNQGRRPRCFGSDIDIICVKMAVVNMLMNSIPGEIAWMNAHYGALEKLLHRSDTDWWNMVSIFEGERCRRNLFY